MMNSISLLWYESDEKSIDDCSNVLVDFFTTLKIHEPVFNIWFEKGKSRKKALENRVIVSSEYFSKILDKNWDKRFYHLGSRVSFWNGAQNENESCGISFNLGAYGNKPFHRNSCVMRLPSNYSEKNDVRSIIKLMVDYWNPDKVLINGEEVRSIKDLEI